MKSRLKIELVFFICLFSPLIGFAQTNSALPLDAPIKKFKAKNSNLIGVLSQLSSENNIPIGFIADTQINENILISEISVSLKNVELKKVLDEIIQKIPSYEWTINDGAVLFRPKIFAAGVVKDLANTKVKNFVVNGKISYLNLRAELTNIPEIKSILSSYNITPSHIDMFLYNIKKIPEFSILAQDSLFIGILNQIAIQGEKKLWVINIVGEKKNELRLNFL